MIRPNTVHSLMIAGIVAACGFAINGSSLAKSGTVSHSPSDVRVMNDLQPGHLITTTCPTGLTGASCLAVPVAVNGRDADGNPTTSITTYEVGPELVDQIKKDFTDTANVVLRNIRPAIVQASKSSDSETKEAGMVALSEINEEVPYIVRPGVTLPLQIEKRVAQIAQKQYAQTGRPIVITSGTRSPESQADAMRTKLAMGDNVMGLYRDKKAAASIVHAYREAKHTGASNDQVTERMSSVIEKQVEKGVYISRHLKSGAVDIRTRDLSPEEHHDLMAAIQQTPGVLKTLQESTPPHLHVELQ